MKLTGEQLNEFFFGDLAGDSLFGTGTVIMIDGCAWELTEIVDDQYFFSSSDDIETAAANLNFFAERIHND